MTRTGILRMTNRFLTGTSAVGDAVPGAAVAGYTGQPNQYSGQLGAIDEMNFAEAQSRSDSVTGIALQGGRFQYVQFAADGTTYAAGQVLYWKDETNYIVTNVAPTATSANVAGFCIAPVTQGNYWFMQTAGVVWAQYRATVTSTVISNGVYVVVNTNTVDALTDATAANDSLAGTNKLFVGIAKDQPANAGLLRVYLTNLMDVF